MRNLRPTHLPDFRPVSLVEMRELWIKHPDPEIRRLILEIAHYRETIKEVDRLYHSIQRSWREIEGGHLISLHLLKTLASQEMERMGLHSQP